MKDSNLLKIPYCGNQGDLLESNGNDRAPTMNPPPPPIPANDRPNILGGVVFSAGLLTALGGLLAIYVPFYTFMLCVVFVRGSIPPGRHIGSLVVTILGAAALSYLCFRAGNALNHARRWAAYVAMAWGLLLAYFGGGIILDLFRPYQPGAVQGEDLFEFLIAVPCIAVGVWWCVYLNLPHVRKRIQAVENGQLLLRSSQGR